MKTTHKPGLAGPDGKHVKAPTTDTTGLTYIANISVDPGSDTSPGKLRLKPGAESAYQPIVLALGSGIVLRGQVYVPRRLLKPAAVARAEQNARDAEAAKAAGPAAGQPRMADGSIG